MKFLPLALRNLARNKRRTALTILFANSAAETETESEVGAAESQMGGWRVLFDGAEVLAAIVIVAIGLVAANTSAMSARERRPEIAVMRAIGYSGGLMVFCFLVEGVKLPTLVVVESMIVAITIGIASSLIPGLAAARRNISASLRTA